MSKKLENIYHKGITAFKNGKQPKDCPYKEGTTAYKAWIEGYMDEDIKESGERE